MWCSCCWGRLMSVQNFYIWLYYVCLEAFIYMLIPFLPLQFIHKPQLLIMQQTIRNPCEKYVSVQLSLISAEVVGVVRQNVRHTSLYVEVSKPDPDMSGCDGYNSLIRCPDVHNRPKRWTHFGDGKMVLECWNQAELVEPDPGIKRLSLPNCKIVKALL